MVSDEEFRTRVWTALRAKGCVRCKRIACGGQPVSMRRSGRGEAWTLLALCPGCLAEARAYTRYDIHVWALYESQEAA